MSRHWQAYPNAFYPAGTLNAGARSICIAQQLFVRHFGEPALHEVPPLRVCGRKMDVDARPLREPVANQRRLVPPIVVHDQMHVEVLRHDGIDSCRETAELRSASSRTYDRHPSGQLFGHKDLSIQTHR
jgi:hypothetical protein